MDLKWPLEIDSAGRLVTVDGVEETRQRALIALRTQQGDWDFDTSYGVPYRQLMSQKPPPLEALRAAMVAALLRVPGLDSVDELELDVDERARTLTVSGSCTASGVSFGVEA